MDGKSVFTESVETFQKVFLFQPMVLSKMAYLARDRIKQCYQQYEQKY